MADEAVEEVAEEAEGAPAEETPEQQPKPGTPDKALQKMQQELGNVTRQLAALTEKKNSGELSDADKSKLAKAQERIQKIRQFASEDPIAEHVLELTEEVGKTGTLEAELKATKDRLAVLENDRAWGRARERFAGLDVDAIWDKATTDAAETLGPDGTTAAVQRLASKFFEDRCEAAKKRLKEEPKPGVKKEAPAQYKVGSGIKPAPQLSERDALLAEARSLVREI